MACPGSSGFLKEKPVSGPWVGGGREKQSSGNRAARHGQPLALYAARLDAIWLSSRVGPFLSHLPHLWRAQP